MYFIYPETCGVRLEEMDSLFGDASTVIGTPSLHAENDSLMRPGSPIGSIDYRGRPGHLTAGNAIPGLSLDPPDIPDGKDQDGEASSTISGWVSRVVGRTRDPSSSGSGRYAPVNNQDD